MAPIFVVDAFSEEPFRGNPAAVCLLQNAVPDGWMQSLAAEMKHAETAFLVRAEGDDPARFGLRWFTPACEVDLCGHATLAAAHVLYAQRLVEPTTRIEFTTKSGMLAATCFQDQIELDFPAEPVREAPSPIDLVQALGHSPVFVGRNRLDWLVELESEAAVRSVEPDLASIASIPGRGLIVTARGTEFDFVSRFFAPAAGVPEDDVTGSAHCALAPYWQERLDRRTLVGYQASARGGVVGVAVEGARVKLRGRAVTVLSGTLKVAPETSAARNAFGKPSAYRQY